MNKLLIVTDLGFPGSAMASRLLAFSKLFNSIGYSVHIVAGKTGEKNIEPNKIYKEDYYSYEILNSKRDERLQSYLGNGEISLGVDDYLSKNETDLVFMTSLGSDFSSTFKVIRKHNKKIILEQCEWFDYSSYTFKKLDPRFLRFNYNFKNKFKNVDGVITISRLLEDYYEKLNVKTIRIPSICDVKNKPFNQDVDNPKIKIVFTGNTSNSKELLEPVFEALNSNEEFKKKIELNIYGSNEDTIKRNINKKHLLDDLKDVVIIHGRVPQNKIEGILLNSNYQIFIRPNRRSSDAGFPTKLCESMSVGTPCITNDTGDISLVLKDGVNGFIAKGNTTEDVIEVFNKIIKLDKNDYINLRINARKASEEFFDYRNYQEILKELLNRL